MMLLLPPFCDDVRKDSVGVLEYIGCLQQRTVPVGVLDQDDRWGGEQIKLDGVTLGLLEACIPGATSSTPIHLWPYKN